MSSEFYEPAIELDKLLRESNSNQETVRIHYFLRMPPPFADYFEKLEKATIKTLAQGPNVTQTALQHAIISNNILKVSLLVRLGANIHAQDSKGRGFIHICTSAKMVTLLVECGIDIAQRSFSGDIALHNVGHVDAARELINRGLSVNSRNNSQSTPLHYSLDPNMTMLFLSHGGNPNLLNYYKHTPLHLVASRGIWEVAYRLLCGGCDASIKGADGLTAVSLSITKYQISNTFFPRSF
jgi:ankyrin repeat protein